ncbi:MAG: glycosyltransferase family 39 protein [Verrucomicrobia subdivision 3 bacterium]|nr:glycosyltransferase family 39 protein [Limisphaerales bacterium]
MNRSALAFASLTLAVSFGFHAIWNAYEPWREYRAVSSAAATIVAYASVWLMGRGARGRETLALVDRVTAMIAQRGRWLAVAVTVLGLMFLAFTAKVVLEAFPNSGDELAFVMQADTYRMGRLYTDAPAHPEFFRLVRYLVKDGKWFSRYQAGWPAVMTVFNAVGVPYWLINPLLGVAAAWAFFVLCRSAVKRNTAIIGVLALGTSAFFILNFASLFSHGLMLLCTILLALSGRRFLESGAWRYAAAAGLCVGLIGFSRAFDAIAVAAPFVAALLLTKDRRHGLYYFALGGLPFIVLLGMFNAGVTGDPLLNPSSWFSSSEPVGQINSKTMGLTAERLFLLQLWTSPVLLPSFAVAFIVLARSRKLDFIDWIAPVLFAAFVFYGGDAGQQYGPRYYFAVWPMMILTILKALDPVLSGANRQWSAVAAAAVCTHLAFQVGFAVPRLVLEHNVVSQRQEMYRAVEKAGLKDAVVVISSATGRIRELMARDLVRNGPVIGDEPVTYALDLGAKNALLLTLFPGREIYRYACGHIEKLEVTPDAKYYDCPGTMPDPIRSRPLP